MTRTVASRLRTRLATTWPMTTEDLASGIERNRSTIPLVMSEATAAAVVPAPKPAHSTIRPGTT